MQGLDFQTLMNQLLLIKTQAENELGMNSDEIKKLKIVQQGFMNSLIMPNITFELAKDTDGNKYILFKQKLS